MSWRFGNSARAGRGDVGAASVRHPRLEIYATRVPQEIQLQWPSGCLCGLEENPDVADPRGWKAMAIQPTENGNRVGYAEKSVIAAE